MASGLVLVIEDDEWVSRLLANAIRDAGYDVLACATAKEGFETACSEEPSCIICDVELPDGDGFWVARNIRTQPSRVSVTPFIFLSGLDDPESRMEGYQVGGDIYITKPFRIQEVVAQIEALVLMAARMRKRHDSIHAEAALAPIAAEFTSEVASDLADLLEMPVPSEAMGGRSERPKSEPATAIEGDLSQMSIATVLTVLEMERRTGLFEVVSKKRRAQLEIASGSVVQGTVGGTRVSALTTLRTMLGWTVGRFSFTPLPTREPPTTRKSISAFLLEATRLEDEAIRDELDLPPSRRVPGQRLSAPALGGPASTADDLAPLSSQSMSAPPGVISSAVPSSTQPMSPQKHVSEASAAPRAAAREPEAPPSEAQAARHAPEARRSRPSSDRSPSGHLSETALPLQTTLELDDIEPISAAPTGTAPIFPGLANITGTQRFHKSPGSPPPAPPPLATRGSPPPAPKGSPPRQAAQGGGPQAPPPLPKREPPTPAKPVTTPPSPPAAAPRRAPEGPSGATGATGAAAPPPLPRTGVRQGPPPLPQSGARPQGPPPLPKPEGQPKKR